MILHIYREHLVSSRSKKQPEFLDPIQKLNGELMHMEFGFLSLLASTINEMTRWLLEKYQ